MDRVCGWSQAVLLFVLRFLRQFCGNSVSGVIALIRFKVTTISHVFQHDPLGRLACSVPRIGFMLSIYIQINSKWIAELCLIESVVLHTQRWDTWPCPWEEARPPGGVQWLLLAVRELEGPQPSTQMECSGKAFYTCSALPLLLTHWWINRKARAKLECPLPHCVIPSPALYL